MKKRGKSRPKAHKAPRSRAQGGGSPAVVTRADGAHRAFESPRLTTIPANRRPPPKARAVAVPAYEHDERLALALLLLPFLIMALSLGVSQTLKPVGSLIEASRPALPVAAPARVAVAPGSIVHAPLSMPAAVPAALRAPDRIVLSTPLSMPAAVPAALRVPEPFVPATPLAMPRQAPTIPAPATVATLVVPPPPVVLPLQAPEAALRDAVTRLAVLAVPPPPVVLPLQAPEAALRDAVTRLASLIVPPPLALPKAAPEIRVPPALDTYACLAAQKPAKTAATPPASEFGARLAEAAEAQTRDFVIYSATYKRIAYPMGDVPSLYGACSDLVVRAYRALGIDLQDLVQRARVGSGDPNIDHRRTETLRAFFARHGQSIPPSTFAEDYKPGDIVTYYRPYSRVSRAHIAIVSDRLGPSGQPMIVHNRGWGPQLEDALFVDRITGHYRFAGAAYLTAPAGRIAAGADGGQKAAPKLPLQKASSAARTADRAGGLR